MTDAIAALQLTPALLQLEPTAPPVAPVEHDVSRFESAINATSEPMAPVEDLSPPSLIDPGDQWGERIMGGVSAIDKRYREVIDRVLNWPSRMGIYLKNNPASGAAPVHQANFSSGDDWTDFESQLRSRVSLTAESSHVATDVVHHSNLNNSASGGKPEDFAAKLNAMTKETQAIYAAGIEYSRDTTRWFLSTEFWMTKLKIITAAVEQTKTGLTTLFRSGGG